MQTDMFGPPLELLIPLIYLINSQQSSWNAIHWRTQRHPSTDVREKSGTSFSGCTFYQTKKPLPDTDNHVKRKNSLLECLSTSFWWHAQTSFSLEVESQPYFWTFYHPKLKRFGPFSDDEQPWSFYHFYIEKYFSIMYRKAPTDDKEYTTENWTRQKFRRELLQCE